MMPEDDSALSEVHADLVGRLEHDKRLRAVEVEQASMRSAFEAMRTELPKVEERLTAAIAASKVNIWPAVGAICAVVLAALTIAGFASGSLG